ncbi:acetoin dehydrogenase [Corynebacterium phocae]|uniref:Acetoin utilization protein AcuC n=1 Tax=Corynebacterium phocae TaxID=161895 RepID=A0A1L7D3R6_9CORY|nr:acetoin utilization protein AcuC [Corynebacterium phocae]APT92651.1 acetoin dehydrogenase [Corynebacterium phocae]KAA8723704.1 acetoin utilization protein AcuC [Corynebacterium phocae]
MNKPLVVCSEEIYHYSLGDNHPMGPDRVRTSLSLAQHFQVLPEFDLLDPTPVNEKQLLAVHDPGYVAATRSGKPAPEFGIGTTDNPHVPGLEKIAAKITGGTLDAVRAVWEGRAPRAVNLSGGLHHAFRNSMSGFCMYNDAAVAIHWLLANGAKRVAYIDTDAHHGDGVEQLFWDDPRVLTISVHESGMYLFPGTGFPHDIGGPRATGTAVNVALPRETDDFIWLQSLHATVAPLLQKFKPDFIISQHGADPHRADPLADLQVSIDAMAVAYRSIGRWADKFAGGKWVALGGGGYALDSVARAWTQVLAAVAGVEIEPSATLPANWAQRTKADPSQLTMGDTGVDLSEFNPDRVMAQQPTPALIATSKTIFPYWGLRVYG